MTPCHVKEERAMSAEKMIANAVDPDEKWLYRVGGMSALILGIAYIVIIGLYVYAGAPPSGGEEWLNYAAGKTTVWWAILGLSVVTDFLFVPVAFSLYLALKGISRSVMLLATAFVGLFVVLDLAVTWSNYASLISLSGDYAAATTDAQREAYIAAANHASAVLTSTLEGVYSIVVLAVGILLIGVVMLRGVFGQSVAYLGLATGILGIVSVAGPFLVSALRVTIIIASVLTTVWVFLVGRKLYWLGQH
jgi:hypothetical protein